MELADLVDRIPVGWSEVRYRGRRWGLARRDHAGGRTVTIEAEELGGAIRMGANVIRLTSGDLLRPCEIPEADVLDLLEGWEPLTRAQRSSGTSMSTGPGDAVSPRSRSPREAMRRYSQP